MAKVVARENRGIKLNMTIKELENPSKRKDIISREINGETILYISNTESVHVLNKTASIIWSLCDGRHDINEIAGKIARKYNADYNHILKEV